MQANWYRCNMKKILSILLLLPLSVMMMAEEENWMSPDRPGMATGTDVMPFKKVMWETGFEGDWDGSSHVVTLPTTMFRFGITPFAELRVEYDGTLQQNGKQWDYAPEPLVLGTKVRVFDGSDQYKWIPKTSLMVNLEIPCTKQMASTMHVAPSVYALFSNDVTDWFNIGYNVGAEWDGTSAIPATFLAVCLGFNITDDLGAFVESYNYFTKYGIGNTAADPNIDFGFNWMVHQKVQLDVYAGFSCMNPKNFSMVGLGVAWLIN